MFAFVYVSFVVGVETLPRICSIALTLERDEIMDVWLRYRFVALLLTLAFVVAGGTGGKNKWPKVTWWQDSNNVHLSMAMPKPCKRYRTVFSDFHISVSCGSEPDSELLGFQFREGVDSGRSACKQVSTKKISCEFWKQESHVFDRLLSSPEAPGVQVSRNWDKWNEVGDTISPILLQHLAGAKVPSLDKDALAKAVVSHDAVVAYFAHPWDPLCLKHGVVYGDVSSLLNGKNKAVFFGWIDAREQSEFASGLGITGGSCRTYVWRRDDNQTVPSYFQGGIDARSYRRKLENFLRPVLAPILSEKNLTAFHRKQSLALVGFFDRPMRRSAIDIFRKICIRYRDGAHYSGSNAAPEIHCAVAVESVATELGEKYGIKFGIAFFRKHSSQIILYSFSKATDGNGAKDLQEWVEIHKNPMFARFDAGVYDRMKSSSLPLGLLFLGNDKDRDSGDALGDVHDDSFMSVAKSFLGKIQFFWVGTSDFFRLNDFGTSPSYATLPFFGILSNGSYGSLKYALESDADQEGGAQEPATPVSVKAFCTSYLKGGRNMPKPTQLSGPIPSNNYFVPGYVREVVWKTLDSAVFDAVDHKETLLFLVNRDDGYAKKINSVAVMIAKAMEGVPDFMVGAMDIVENYADPALFPGASEYDLRPKVYLIATGGTAVIFNTDKRVRKRKGKKKKGKNKLHSIRDVAAFVKKRSHVLKDEAKIMHFSSALARAKHNQAKMTNQEGGGAGLEEL